MNIHYIAALFIIYSATYQASQSRNSEHLASYDKVNCIPLNSQGTVGNADKEHSPLYQCTWMENIVLTLLTRVYVPLGSVAMTTSYVRIHLHGESD